MTVEAIDSVDVDSNEYIEFEQEGSSSWNGRLIQINAKELSMSNTQAFFEKLQDEATQNKLFSFTFSHQPGVVCLSGKAGASASVDTDGNKEVEAHVEISSETGNASVEVQGSVSQDAQGNTNAGVTISGEIEF